MYEVTLHCICFRRTDIFCAFFSGSALREATVLFSLRKAQIWVFRLNFLRILILKTEREEKMLSKLALVIRTGFNF